MRIELEQAMRRLDDAVRASASVVTSSIDSGSTGADEPPGQKTFTLRPSGGPPASSMITWRNVLPFSTSYTPGLHTLPLTDKRRVPGDFSRSEERRVGKE